MDITGEEPEHIVLDLDATDDAVHGKQEGRSFHGHYDHHCYLPLYIISGNHVLAARLRPSNIGASVGTILAPVAIAYSCAMAAGVPLDSCRYRLLPRCYHGMVRSAGPALPHRYATQCAAEAHRLGGYGARPNARLQRTISGYPFQRRRVRRAHAIPRIGSVRVET